MLAETPKCRPRNFAVCACIGHFNHDISAEPPSLFIHGKTPTRRRPPVKVHSPPVRTWKGYHTLERPSAASAATTRARLQLHTRHSLRRSQSAQTRHSPSLSPRPALQSLLILRYRSMKTSPPSKRLWARRSASSCLLGYGGSSSSLKHVFACGSLVMSYTLMIWKRLGPVAP